LFAARHRKELKKIPKKGVIKHLTSKTGVQIGGQVFFFVYMYPSSVQLVFFSRMDAMGNQLRVAK